MRAQHAIIWLVGLAVLLSACNRQSSHADPIKDIQSTDRDRRNEAVSHFSRSASQRDIDALVKLLDETTDPDVRIDIARALSMGRPSPQAVPVLLKLIEVDQPYVRHAAVEALGRTGDQKAAHALVAALCDEDSEVRHTAATAYQHLQYTGCVEPLLGLLSFDVGELRKGASAHDSAREAIQALGYQRDPRAVPTLVRMMATEVESLSRPAAKAIGDIVGQDFTEMVYVSFGHQMRMGSPSKAHAWLKEHDDVRANAEGVRLLEQLEKARTEAGRLCVTRDATDAAQSLDYLALVPMGKIAVPALLERWTCQEAWCALSLMHDPDLAGFYRRRSLLGQVLLSRRDLDGYVRELLGKGISPSGCAALALARTGDRQYVTPLGKDLASPTSPRREIILALQELGDPAGAEYIRSIFAFYPDADWAPLAVAAVEHLDAARSVEFFKLAVQSASTDVVARALDAIRNVGDASCVWYVEEAMKRNDLPESAMRKAKDTLAALRKRS